MVLIPTMDNCFNCLSLCNESICNTCNAVGHIKCLTLLISRGIIKCPICRSEDIKKPRKPHTRNDSKKEELIELKHLIGSFYFTRNTEERTESIEKTFEYLSKHTLLLKSNKKFYLVAKEKLVSLHNEGWENASFYNKKIFGYYL